jgi:SAM-dependent methyltransferase
MKIDNKQVEEVLKDWYTKSARYEWRRLRQDPYHQIELNVTMHFVEKYLPKRGLVLDAGGGPGRYAIELAKRGYSVVLLDLVPEMLKVAKRQVRRAGVQRRVKRIIEGSIDNLQCWIMNHLMPYSAWEHRPLTSLMRRRGKGRYGTCACVQAEFPDPCFCYQSYRVT